MATRIFVNLPVKNLEKPVDFWFARPSPPGEQPTTNRKTTALCMDMGFRTWTATFGN